MKHSRMARSAALALTLCAFAAPTAGAGQDLRNPDTRDAALAAAPEVTVVKVTKASPASDGFDWGDAGIGAGGLLGLTLIGFGGIFMVLHRRVTGTTIEA